MRFAIIANLHRPETPLHVMPRVHCIPVFKFLSNMITFRIISLLLLLQRAMGLTSQYQFFDHGLQWQSSPHSPLTDKAALLAFKMTITNDPKSTLANWNDANELCNFTGVICSSKNHRVAHLILEGADLVSSHLSPFLSNLTDLRILNLALNHFSGIPPDFSSLRNLHYLHFDENKLHGPLPHFIFHMPYLKVVTLDDNNFSGTIPPSFFSNSDDHYTNCSLENIDLSSNSLTGNIPPGVGSCRNLWTLNLYNNQLTGSLPATLVNASNLKNLDVENNSLTGELPSEIVVKLASLQHLHLAENNMMSHDNNTNLEPFFASLANCTSLEELHLDSMGLGGNLPTSISLLGANLTSLLLQENNIVGPVPAGLANLSGLMELNLTSNLLKGMFPAEISSNLLRLELLFLSDNHFPGEIPTALGQLANLNLLDLSHNQYTGEIPRSLGNLSKVNSLFLNHNLLSGTIPSSLGKCTHLYQLDLSHNRLTGKIPPEISGIGEMRIFLNLSHNHLEGDLPIDLLRKLDYVEEIDLSSNHLTGRIPPQISGCIALKVMNIYNNLLEGPLPESIGSLKSLELFDASKNYLSGNVPQSLNKMSTLKFLNLSFNNLDGILPSGGIFDSASNISFLGNPRLCTSSAAVSGELPNCPKKQPLHQFKVLLLNLTLIFLVVTSIFAMSMSCRHIMGLILTAKRKVDAVAGTVTPDKLQSFPRITYWELLDATGGFDQERLIGLGSYGCVYKGVFSDGIEVAVKVLHLQINSTKSFNRECQVLKRIRHRNLMRVITACSLPEFKALVLPYMANGSLESRLYAPPDSELLSDYSDLSLIQRINICSDIAEGMAYLHHHASVRVIHCDLKPSNVLLNDDMSALVSDFGISKLVLSPVGVGSAENMGDSTANLLSGSIGYIAPEYGYGSSTTTNGDVYSFGIIVLEMVTRRRPTDDMFVEGLNLQGWVKSHYQNGTLENVVDPSLVSGSKGKSLEGKRMWEAAIMDLIELGILCTQESPSMRPTMLAAANDLDRLKQYLYGYNSAIDAS